MNHSHAIALTSSLIHGMVHNLYKVKPVREGATIPQLPVPRPTLRPWLRSRRTSQRPERMAMLELGQWEMPTPRSLRV